MNIEKIIYCKCPYCGGHGIKVWGKIGRHSTYTVTCKLCGNKSKANSAILFVRIINILLVIAIIGKLTESLPNYAKFIIAFPLLLICDYIVEYFAPMEKQD